MSVWVHCVAVRSICCHIPITKFSGMESYRAGKLVDGRAKTSPETPPFDDDQNCDKSLRPRCVSLWTSQIVLLARGTRLDNETVFHELAFLSSSVLRFSIFCAWNNRVYDGEYVIAITSVPQNSNSTWVKNQSSIPLVPS